MAAHAKKSASGSKRWINCPGSLALVDRLPPTMRSGSSGAADLGTCAHALGERCLNEGLESSRAYKGWVIQYEDGMESEVWYEPGEAPTAKGFYPVDDDMCSAVDVYLDTVAAFREEMGAETEMFIERRFSLEWLRPDMFGTSDCTLWQFMGLLRAIDYKHGQGVPVEAEDNTQGLYYALGLAHEVEWLFDEVEIVIVQPRCPHEQGSVRKSKRYTKAEIEEFRDFIAAASDRVDEARDALEAIEEAETRGEIDYPEEFGKWCDEYLQVDPKPYGHCGFCEKKPTCPAAFRMAQQIAGNDFAGVPSPLELPEIGEDPADLEHLAKMMEWSKFLDGYVKSINALAQRRLEQGLSVPRHKLVRAKANRVWTLSEEELVPLLIGKGAELEDLYEAPKFKTPAKVEKLGKELKAAVVGKKAPKNAPADTPEYVVEPLAVKGQGKITMAHESDPREAVSYDPGCDFPDDQDEDDDA